MRTQAQLHKDLAKVNVQDLHRLTGISAKTLYRIRQNAEYKTNVKTAEAISRALDRLSGKRSIKVSSRAAEEAAEA